MAKKTNIWNDNLRTLNYTLSTDLNKHAPLKSKISSTKPSNHWLIPALYKLKLAKYANFLVYDIATTNADILRFATGLEHPRSSNMLCAAVKNRIFPPTRCRQALRKRSATDEGQNLCQSTDAASRRRHRRLEHFVQDFQMAVIGAV